MILLRYVRYKPGKDNVIPDALSRAAIGSPSEDEKEAIERDMFEVCSIVDRFPITDERHVELRKKTKADQTLQTVAAFVTHGWLSREHIPDEAKPFYTFHDKITYCNGLLFRGNQVIIPKTLQPEMLKKFMQATKASSKLSSAQSQFWPGMNSQI